jgi:hypothetical protein
LTGEKQKYSKRKKNLSQGHFSNISTALLHWDLGLNGGFMRGQSLTARTTAWPLLVEVKVSLCKQ